MTDTPGHGRPQQDNDQLRHTLTIHEVGARLTAALVPRSERQIKRYCETGFLAAKKIPGPTGEQWFVAPAAVPRLVGDLQQWQMQRYGHGRPRPDTSETVSSETAPSSNADTAGSGRPRPAVAEPEQSQSMASNQQDVAGHGRPQPHTTGHVMQLEKRIAEKDEVIDLLKGQLTTKDKQIGDLSDRFTSLSDRFADTQKLVGAMQRMLAPLLGQADPYTAPETREAKREAGSVDNATAAQS